MSKFVLIFVLACVTTCTVALNSKDVEEVYKCDQFPLDSTFDKLWVNSAPFLYIPFWSKGFLYRIAQDFYTPEEFTSLSLADLNQSCFFYSLNTSPVVYVYAFGKLNFYESYPDPIRSGIRYYTSANGTEASPAIYASSSTVTKTDNKTYFVTMNTWTEGIKNFVVAATVPVLPEEILTEIKAHLTENGFNPEYFATQDYTQCTPPSSFSGAKKTHKI